MVSEQLVGRRLVRVRHADGRERVGIVGDDELELLATGDVLAVLTGAEPLTTVERVEIDDPESPYPGEPWQLLTPLVAPETWAAGVTYERSRDARVHESDVADVYDRVYDAPPTGAVLQGRGRAPDGRARRADRDPDRRGLERPRARARSRSRRRRRAARGDDRQ